MNYNTLRVSRSRMFELYNTVYIETFIDGNMVIPLLLQTSSITFILAVIVVSSSDVNDKVNNIMLVLK